MSVEIVVTVMLAAWGGLVTLGLGSLLGVLVHEKLTHKKRG